MDSYLVSSIGDRHDQHHCGVVAIPQFHVTSDRRVVVLRQQIGRSYEPSTGLRLVLNGLAFGGDPSTRWPQPPRRHGCRQMCTPRPRCRHPRRQAEAWARLLTEDDPELIGNTRDTRRRRDIPPTPSLEVWIIQPLPRKPTPRWWRLWHGNEPHSPTDRPHAEGTVSIRQFPKPTEHCHHRLESMRPSPLPHRESSWGGTSVVLTRRGSALDAALLAG
jgi:hypothetical protein